MKLTVCCTYWHYTTAAAPALGVTLEMHSLLHYMLIIVGMHVRIRVVQKDVVAEAVGTAAIVLIRTHGSNLFHMDARCHLNG